MTPARPSPAGVLVIDKPSGPTSHDVVARIRRVFGTREVGHAGTLDPMATGVLVLALGEATKLVPYLTNATKEYEARVVLGRETDTLDAFGSTVHEQPLDGELRLALNAAGVALPESIEHARRAEEARTAQQPPAFSAIHSDGQRAYARARRGESFALADRPVRVHELVVTGMGSEPTPFIDLRATVDKGYYVRSLARDLARALGTVGHLGALRRTRSGVFTAERAGLLTDEPAELRPRLIPIEIAARQALPVLTLHESGEAKARVGQRVAAEDFSGELLCGVPCAWISAVGALIAIGVFDGEGRVLRGFGPR